QRQLTRVVDLAGNIDNESQVHGGVLFYKAIALRHLGVLHAARDELTALLRRTKDRDPAFLQAVRYERARVYELLGRKSQAKRDLERLFADDPNYEDVAARLGIGSVLPSLDR
ncbi:MAG: DUF4236 domain-containing protein, partial [Planctomycetota bacterium]